MVILSSPSGAGKTTISKKIQQKYQNFKISVSHTTRKPRPNEIDGIDYFFISKDKFQEKIKNKEFYEYAEIFGNYYGTSKETVLELLNNKNDILFDIDNPEVVTKRLASYEEDARHQKDYDYVVTNDNLENCFKEVEKIILSKKN